MGTLMGHVAPGLAFFTIGLWHLFNTIKIHALNPPGRSIPFPPWFPATTSSSSKLKIKYLEPVLIIASSAVSISMELFIGPRRHQPLDVDGTIPSYHLQNFEHSNISFTFFVFGCFCIVLDWVRPKGYFEVTQLLGAVGFSQELLVFRVHSADHVGAEGQYHLLLQSLVAVSLLTTLLGIHFPDSFLVAFVRSISILFQGVWLVVMGLALWTPSMIPKGCFMHSEAGHKVVRCGDDLSLHRAKSLINIQFSWLLISITIFAISFYLIFIKLNEDGNQKPKVKVVEYLSLMSNDELDEEEKEELSSDIVAHNNNKNKQRDSMSMSSFVEMGRKFTQIDIENR